MFTVSLIAAPGRLDPALAISLRDAWGCGDLVWLAPDEAAEFEIGAPPSNAPDVWRALQDASVDLAVQNSANRRKRILIADMDSTMIQQECIDELAAEAGVGPHVADITARAMNGDLDFEAALRERVGLLAGQPTAIIDKVLSERITLMPGGAELVATMRANGAHAALVSGGFTCFASAIARRLGFDEHLANTLVSEGGVLTGHPGEPILGREAKVAALEQIACRLGLSPQDALAVGDGANDLGMIRLAGTGVALHAKPSVQAEADIRINHSDLSALLFLQGYARSDFVSEAGDGAD